jgi:hypothetical protein
MCRMLHKCLDAISMAVVCILGVVELLFYFTLRRVKLFSTWLQGGVKILPMPLIFFYPCWLHKLCALPKLLRHCLEMTQFISNLKGLWEILVITLSIHKCYFYFIIKNYELFLPFQIAVINLWSLYYLSTPPACKSLGSIEKLRP